MASAAKAGGTKIIEVSAPAFSTASKTVLKTGFSQMHSSSFARSHTTNYIGSVVYHLFGVK